MRRDTQVVGHVVVLVVCGLVRYAMVLDIRQLMVSGVHVQLVMALEKTNVVSVMGGDGKIAHHVMEVM